MVQTTLDALCLDSSSPQCIKHLVRNLFATNIGEFLLVVVIRETVETAITYFSQYGHVSTTACGQELKSYS